MPRRPREVQLLIESSNHPVSEHLKKAKKLLEEIEKNDTEASRLKLKGEIEDAKTCAREADYYKKELDKIK